MVQGFSIPDALCALLHAFCVLCLLYAGLLSEAGQALFIRLQKVSFFTHSLQCDTINS